MYASFLRICAPCIWIFFLCRPISTFYNDVKNGKALQLPIGTEDLASDGICLPAGIGAAHEDSFFTIDDNPLSATTDC